MSLPPFAGLTNPSIRTSSFNFFGPGMPSDFSYQDDSSLVKEASHQPSVLSKFQEKENEILQHQSMGNEPQTFLRHNEPTFQEQSSFANSKPSTAPFMSNFFAPEQQLPQSTAQGIAGSFNKPPQPSLFGNFNEKGDAISPQNFFGNNDPTFQGHHNPQQMSFGSNEPSMASIMPQQRNFANPSDSMQQKSRQTSAQQQPNPQNFSNIYEAASMPPQMLQRQNFSPVEPMQQVTEQKTAQKQFESYSFPQPTAAVVPEPASKAWAIASLAQQQQSAARVTAGSSNKHQPPAAPMNFQTSAFQPVAKQDDALLRANSKNYRKNAICRLEQVNVERNRYFQELEATKAKLRLYHEQIEAMKNDLTRSRSDYSALQNRSTDDQKQIKKFEQKLLNVETVHDVLKNKMQAFEENKQNLDVLKLLTDKNFEEVDIYLDQLKAMSDYAEETLRSLVTETSENAKAIADQRDTAITKVKRLEDELEEWKTRDTTNSETIANLEQQVEKQAAENKEIRQQHGSIANDLAVEKAKNEEATDELSNASKIMATKSSEFEAFKNTAETKIKDLEEELADMRNLVQQLNEKNLALENERTSLQAQVDEFIEKTCQLESKLDEQIAAVQTKLDENTSLQTKVETLVEEIQGINKEKSELSLQMLEKSLSLEKTVEENKKSFNDKTFLEKDLKLTTEEVFALKKEATEKIRCISDYKEKLDESEKKIFEKEGHVFKLEEELAKQKEGHENVSEEVEKINEELVKRKNDYEHLQKQMDAQEIDHKKQVEKIVAAYEHIEKENVELKKNLARTKREKDSNTLSLQDVQKQLDHAERDCTLKSIELDRAMKELQSQSSRRGRDIGKRVALSPAISPNKMTTPVKHASPAKAVQLKKTKMNDGTASDRSYGSFYQGFTDKIQKKVPAAEQKRKSSASRKANLPVPIDHSTAKKESGRKPTSVDKEASDRFDFYVLKNSVTSASAKKKKMEEKKLFPDVQTYTRQTKPRSLNKVATSKTVTGLDWFDD